MDKATWGETCREKAEGKTQVAAAVETLERALRECFKPFFGGDSPGYVDVVLGGLLPWVCATDKRQAGVKTFDPTTTPLLAMWNNHFGAIEEVQALMPDVGELVDLAIAMPIRRPGCPLQDNGRRLQVDLLFISLLLQIVTSCC